MVGGVVVQSGAKSFKLKHDELDKSEKNPVVIADKPGYWRPDLHPICNACGKMTSQFKVRGKASRTCDQCNKGIKKHQYHFNCACGHDLYEKCNAANHKKPQKSSKQKSKKKIEQQTMALQF